MQTGRRLGLLAIALAAAVLAGCGGGGGSEPPRQSISRVVVAGDSLADVGAFGMKFTIQSSADPSAGFPVFPQIVAENFGVTGQCNFFVIRPAPVPITNADCTNFAVAGGGIAHVNPLDPNDPRNIPLQLQTAAQVLGTYTANDLVIVDGGGNDAAELVVAFLLATRGDVAAYRLFLSKQLPLATIDATLPQPDGAALLGGMYMQALADTYYAAIKVNTLDKGATHVAVLNMPDITLTPRFGALLTGIGQAQGAAAAAQLRAAIQQWITAFNTQLQARVGGDARIALVDFHADFTDEVAHPATYGLTNATAAACPVTGVDDAGLPTYTFATCTTAALDAAPPAGLAPGWWQTWAFSDGFHPTPFAHRLLASSVSRAIARAGWI